MAQGLSPIVIPIPYRFAYQREVVAKIVKGWVKGHRGWDVKEGVPTPHGEGHLIVFTAHRKATL